MAKIAVLSAFVGGSLLFVAVGTVRVGAGSRQGDEARVIDVWRRFVSSLPEVGNPTLLMIAVLASLAVFAVLSALGLWLAMIAEDGVTESPAGEPRRG